MKKITFGIIGAGMIAEDHVNSIMKLPAAGVKWICDIRREAAEKLGRIHGISDITNDINEVTEDPDVDAVVIATPPHTHHKLFMQAISSGKHILLEKPMGINRSEAESIIHAAEEHPGQVVIDASARHSRLNPKYRKVKEIIDSGLLGEVYFIHHNALYRQGRPGIEYHPEAKWFLDRSRSGGGPLFDWGVYDMSFHMGILSDRPVLQSVSSHLFSGLDAKDPGADVFDVEEHGIAMMEFSDGLKYYWERAGHANVETPDETRIYGTRGGLKFSFLTWESPEIELYTLKDQGAGAAVSESIEVDFSQHGGDGFELMKHFVAIVRGEEKPILPMAASKRNIDILFRVYESVK